MVTGLDFSPAAIREATLLAQRAGLSESSTFVCSDVYDAPAALSDHRFDVVYVSLGALCWLPDVAAWGEVVARLLNPGGRLYLHDVHPFSATLDDEGEQVAYSYFTRPDQPIVGDYDTTYTDGAKLTSTETYEWIHPMGAVVESLISRGLVLDSLVEHDWTVFQQFPWLESDGSHRYFIPEGRPRIPLTFTVLAHAPG
jgi:SAM-dependent methyltransferase